VQTDKIAAEVPLWLELAVAGLGFGGGLALKLGLQLILRAAAGGFAGGMLGHWSGGKAFGEGSDGQKLSALGCSLIGGLVSTWGGRYFDIHYQFRVEGLGANFGNIRVIPKINGRATINGEYAGNVYPSSNLPVNIRARYPDGIRFNRDGFPEFPSKADIELPPNQHIGSRTDHFRLANELLKLQEQKNPGYLYRQGLNQQQVAHVMKNPSSPESPPGLTWHHNERPGVMQLVPRDIHNAVRHTGGYSIWGKG